jgi:hypothetical protein
MPLKGAQSPTVAHPGTDEHGWLWAGSFPQKRDVPKWTNLRWVLGPRGLAVNSDAGDLLEKVLVAGVGTILAVRFYLDLTGYPQVGGNGLHVAHLLWGGLLLLFALTIALAFLGRRMPHLAAIIGGVGFGLFIDELGKFVTSDNNYFFRPTIAIIYALFVLLFLAFQSLARPRTVTAPVALATALALVEDAVLHGWTAVAHARTVRALRLSDSDEPLVGALLAAVGAVYMSPEPPTRRARLLGRIRGGSGALVRTRWFRRGLIGLLGLQAVSTIVGGVVVALSAAFGKGTFQATPADWGSGASAALAAVCIVIGLNLWRRSRLTGYLWLKRALLISLLLGQFFAFVDQELAGISGLIVNLLLLAALGTLIRDEQGAVAENGDAELPSQSPLLEFC